MEFDESTPIYLQIADWIYDKILRNEWAENDRILSVRELGMALEVNPNTVMRTYEKLQSQEIIYNRRGIGYFTSPDAKKRIRKTLREHFLSTELPRIFERMELLAVSEEDVYSQYELFKKRKKFL